MNDLGKIFLLVGGALVVAGVVLLGFLGVAIYQIIEAPNDVGLVKFVLEHLRSGERMIYGNMGNETFELSVTEPARTVFLLFLAVMAFWIIAGIAKSIIAAGVNMIRVMSSLAKEQTALPPGSHVGRVD